MQHAAHTLETRVALEALHVIREARRVRASADDSGERGRLPAAREAQREFRLGDEIALRHVHLHVDGAHVQAGSGGAVFLGPVAAAQDFWRAAEPRELLPREIPKMLVGVHDQCVRG